MHLIPIVSLSSAASLAAIPSWLINTPAILLMIFGFGFVVFFHELGHFLAAKAMGIKVEQFAVGMGQAVISYRRGLGFRWGSSRKEYEAAMAPAEEGAAPKAPPKKMGETEYRVNWMPLGGYVKMLGQDDLRPGAEVDDPGAYNNKSVGARMIVVSAGVVMNIILAALLFMLLFRVLGFSAPPPVVGSIAVGSPAQKAGLLPGDEVKKFGSHVIHDSTELLVYPPLGHEGDTVPVEISRPKGDGTYENRTLYITPERPVDQPKGFLTLGLTFSSILRAPDADDMEALSKDVDLPAEMKLLKPGERIVAINGQPVTEDEFYKLDRAIQESDGKPVQLTVAPPLPASQKNQGNAAPATQPAQQTHTVEVQPHFESFENATGGSYMSAPFNVAGLTPRLKIAEVFKKDPADGKLQPDDVLLSMKISAWHDAPLLNPQFKDIQRLTKLAGENGQMLDVTVLRDGKPVTISNLAPRKNKDNYVLGISVNDLVDEQHAVVSCVQADTAAARATLVVEGHATTQGAAATSPSEAGIPAGSTILAIDQKPVHNWFEVRDLLSANDSASSGKHVVQVQLADSKETRLYQMNLEQSDITELGDLRYVTLLPLDELRRPRKTDSTLVAASWGVTETKDFVLQFYVTIKRMCQGSVSVSNVMGPVGMFQAGAKFAEKGMDWLTWFLALISANLAVVNFLPIPIVDGGLFTFLIIEKVRGRPLSARTQSIAQVVGLVLIVSVFLLVTYQDIARNF